MKRIYAIILILLSFVFICGFKINDEENNYYKEYDEERCCDVYEVPDTAKFKSYMAYQTITDQTSDQFIMQQYADTTYRGLRCINGRYLIAIGTNFNAAIGQYVDIVLENGYIINCIVGDIKADEDTNEDNTFTTENGCCSEFIIDKNTLFRNVAVGGNMSYLYPWWNSKVKEIDIYDESINIEYLRENYYNYLIDNGLMNNDIIY